MKQLSIQGVYKKGDKIFTINPESCRGLKVYNEKSITFQGKEFRSWNPYRSKLAATILKKETSISIKQNISLLYLGAATGTTISHISDILTQGLIYAIETSPIAMSQLLILAEQRKNIIPILANANHPETYAPLIASVDMIYQDISQRNQADIFLSNINSYLTTSGRGILMIKARSINVAEKPEKIYNNITKMLQSNGYTVNIVIDLSPFQKDHAAIIVTKK